MADERSTTAKAAKQADDMTEGKGVPGKAGVADLGGSGDRHPSELPRDRGSVPSMAPGATEQGQPAREMRGGTAAGQPVGPGAIQPNVAPTFAGPHGAVSTVGEAHERGLMHEPPAAPLRWIRLESGEDVPAFGWEPRQGIEPIVGATVSVVSAVDGSKREAVITRAAEDDMERVDLDIAGEGGGAQQNVPRLGKGEGDRWHWLPELPEGARREQERVEAPERGRAAPPVGTRGD